MEECWETAKCISWWRANEGFGRPLVMFGEAGKWISISSPFQACIQVQVLRSQNEKVGEIKSGRIQRNNIKIETVVSCQLQKVVVRD